MFVASRPAKGPGRTIFELAPLLDSADGSKRIDPKRERGDRVATLSTRGDPRGMLPARRLASLSPASILLQNSRDTPG